jgi:hypothetical protein
MDVKGKRHPRTYHNGPEGGGVDVYIYFFFNLGARGGWWSTQHPGRFTPSEDPVQEAGWAPGTVWTGAENLVPTGIRSPDCPARSESLYRLNYPFPRTRL